MGGGLVTSPLLMSYPAALHVTARAVSGDPVATAVFVHGSLDRGESFRRVMRRLPDVTTVVPTTGAATRVPEAGARWDWAGISRT